jgi:hypothetical protein
LQWFTEGISVRVEKEDPRRFCVKSGFEDEKDVL